MSQSTSVLSPLDDYDDYYDYYDYYDYKLELGYLREAIKSKCVDVNVQKIIAGYAYEIKDFCCSYKLKNAEEIRALLSYFEDVYWKSQEEGYDDSDVITLNDMVNGLECLNVSKEEAKKLFIEIIEMCCNVHEKYEGMYDGQLDDELDDELDGEGILCLLDEAITDKYFDINMQRVLKACGPVIDEYCADDLSESVDMFLSYLKYVDLKESNNILTLDDMVGDFEYIDNSKEVIEVLFAESINICIGALEGSILLSGKDIEISEDKVDTIWYDLTDMVKEDEKEPDSGINSSTAESYQSVIKKEKPAPLESLSLGDDGDDD